MVSTTHEPPRTQEGGQTTTPESTGIHPTNAGGDRGVQELIITPHNTRLFPDFREVWRFRELLLLFCVRDFVVRYKQTVLGALWAVITPLALVLVFTVVFGIIGRIGSDGSPYVLFFFAALIPWRYFEATVGRISTSLLADGMLVRRVYFPRLVGPLRATVQGLFDVAFALAALLVIAAFMGIYPGPQALLVPVILLVAIVAAFGLGLWLAALHSLYRDVAQGLPTVLRAGFFLSPVIYSAGRVPEDWQWLYAINPLVFVIEGFRWALLGTGSLTQTMLLNAIAVAVVLAVSGLWFFNRLEPKVMDAL